MKTFQIIVFLIILPSSRADDLTPSTCEIDTSANNDGDRTIELTAGENKNGIKTVDFTLHGTAFKLDLARPAYVKVTIAANVNKIECSFVGAGLTITAVISTVDTPITIKPGDSVGILFGDKTVKIAHDKAKRDFVPINVEVVKGEVDPTTAQLTLTGAVKPTVKLTTKSDNWLVVPKEQLEAAGDNIDVALTIPADGVVVVTNLLGVKPMIALNKKSSFTCFAKQCSMGIEKKEDVLLEVEILQDVESDKPKFEVGSTKTETIDLRKDYLEVIKELKSEMPATLDCTFSSDLKQILTPPTIAISNLANTDRPLLVRDKVILRTKPTSGTLQFDKTTPESTLNFELLPTSVAKRCYMRFSFVNPEAKRPLDLLKIFFLTNKKTLYFFKDQINAAKLTSEFEVRNRQKERVAVQIDRTPLEIDELLPGSTGKLQGPKTVVVRKPPNNKDITLILELSARSTVDTADFKIGEEVVKVQKSQHYQYLYQSTFGDDAELICNLEEPKALLKYSRIESIVPFRINRGKQMQVFKQSGDFSLQIADPAKGATLQVKGTDAVGIEVILNRNGKDGKPMKLHRGIHGTFEEFLFIYPEDLVGEKELQGNFKMKKGGNVEVTNSAGIQEITMVSRSYVVRKNDVKLSFQKPNIDSFVVLELEEDSQADSVTLEIDGKKHTVDKKTKTVTVPLSKDFMTKNPSPSAKFTTNPADRDGHVNIILRSGTAPAPPGPPGPPAPPAPPKECKPACQGNRDCVQEGDKMQCFCKPGYQGDQCLIIPADNPCSSGPCKNHGTCTHVKEQEFTCQCRNGFEGKTCEIKDPCTPNPCLNKGVCAQNGATFKCTCTVGFKGAICKDKNGGSSLQQSLLSVLACISIAYFFF